MNKLQLPERQNPATKQGSGVNRYALTGAESGTSKLSFPDSAKSSTFRFILNPIPVKGIAVMNPSRGHKTALNNPRGRAQEKVEYTAGCTGWDVRTNALGRDTNVFKDLIRHPMVWRLVGNRAKNTSQAGHQAKQRASSGTSL